MTLPLRLLAVLERLENRHPLLQSLHLARERSGNLGIVATQLRVKVLSVRRGRHGGREDGLDDERVVRLEGVAVGRAEGVRELGCGAVEVMAESLRSEVEAT